YWNYRENPYVQQAVYPTMAATPPANLPAEKSAFNLTVIKLAIFAMIMVLNTNFLYVIFSVPAIDILQAMGEAATTEVIYFVSWLVNDLSAYLIPGLSAFLLFRKELSEKIAYLPHPSVSPVMNGGLTFFAACFSGSMAGLFANAVAALMDSLFGTGEIPDVIGSTVPPEGELGSFGVMFFFVAVTAPIFEELIFRKLLLVPLRKHGDWFAIIVTALIFGFYHGNFDQMPYAFVVGMFFALLAVNTNSVIPSMILHVLNNTMVTLSQYLIQVTGETEPALSIANFVSEGLTLSFWIGIPALAIMIAGKLFKTTHKAALAPKYKAGLIFKNPAFYVFVVFMLLMMVDIGDIVELFVKSKAG
ncbi:MAG: CPBP family intramembrane metalloprotease, partial [Ruminiclostridium sp.]|nr:CPBP family intramembrane metalloprotease [Ruminiclostridium sp.]